MTKKRTEIAKKKRSKSDAGTGDRKAKAGSGKKSARPLNNQSKIVNNECLVWRIFRFGERFELPDDMKICRKSGLQFTRDFVSAAGGDEAVGYINQFKLLDTGDGLEVAMFEGLYRKLVNMAAQHSRAKRGYLIDAADQPLSDVQLGKLLNVKGPTMRRILRQYADVMLLEKVELPEFDFTRNDRPKDDSRKTSENSEKKGAPLKKRQNDKTANANANAKSNVNEQRATYGLTAYAAKDKENGNSKLNANAQGQSQTVDQVQSQGRGSPPMAAGSSHPPTTAPPLPCRQPNESDAFGDSRLIHFSGSPQGSVNLSKAGMSYGRRVYLALGYRHDIDSSEAAREITSFASKHDQVCSMLSSPPVVDGVLNRGLREATKIRRRKASRNPGAIFNSLLDKLATAKLAEDNAEVHYA